MTVKVKVTPSHRLTVGSPATNSISFEITATAAAKLFASVKIPCGEATAGTAYLSGVDKPDLIFRSEPLEIKGKQATKDNELSWVSNAFRLGAGTKSVTITITGFNPESAGTASLHLKIWDDPDVTPYPCDAETKVTIAPAQKGAILSFDASPRNVLQGGQVKISSKTTKAHTVLLLAGDTEVKGGTVVKAGEPLKNEWLDYPETNPATYRLKLDGEFVGGEVTVKVEPRGGWGSRNLLKNSLEPPKQGQHFYPTLLLAAKDLSGEQTGAGEAAEVDRLYGIFTFVDLAQKTKRAELWSSASGVDDWQEASGLRIQGGAELRGAEVPEGMDESPGVIHNNTLWLFGGSSANPAGPFSNRLCGYYKSTDKREMVWDEWKVEKDKLFTPRMGHACAVFNERLWVLGGLSPDGGLLDDVWSCGIPKYAGNFKPDWKKCPTPLPSGGRCMSAVADTPEYGNESARLWLYGGTTHPDNYKETFDELWWTDDKEAEAWHHLILPRETREKRLNATDRATLGATLLYAKGRLHLVRIFQQSGSPPSDDSLEDTTTDPPNWKPEARNFPWATPEFGLFLMRSVVFRERWIFWPVYQYMDELTYPHVYKGKTANYDTMIFNAPK